MANKKSKKDKKSSHRHHRGERERGNSIKLRRKHRSGEGKGEVIECVFSGGGSGFGFAVPVEKGSREDLFIPPDLTMGAVKGDRVKVRHLLPGDRGYGRGNEGAVMEIIERGITELTGVFYIVDDVPVVVPDDRKIGAAVEALSAVCDVAEGDKVLLAVTAYPNEYREIPFVRRRRHRRSISLDISFGGEIVHSYGSAETKTANYEAVLDISGIPRYFSDEVLRAAGEASGEELSSAGRLDLRENVIFTIDGAGAKDLDDAISLEREGDGYILGVHIADVSHYVKKDGVIDREAFDRGTSVYFVDKVVPMLPEALSNGACSLNAGEDKYALSALIHLDSAGEMTSATFHKSIIRSVVRGVYTEVNEILAGTASHEIREKYAPVKDMLREMESLYRILEDRARLRGALELESGEAEIILDDKGLPVEVIPRVRGVAERIIEQFMLRANVAAATFLTNEKRSGVYRIHEEPDRDKMATFAIFAHNMDLDVTPLAKIDGEVAEVCRKVTPAALSRILDSAKEKGVGEVVSGVMLRSLMKAKYSPVPGLHFGLAEEMYCHFTSPIRRYPDLFVHRAITAILEGKSDVRGSGEAAEWSTATEIRATAAERQIEDLYIALYMREHIGETFDATVTGVTSFGVFAATDKMCEGMIPAATLGRETVFNEKMLSLTARDGVQVRTFRLGDRIKITVTAADVATGKVTFAVEG